MSDEAGTVKTAQESEQDQHQPQQQQEHQEQQHHHHTHDKQQQQQQQEATREDSNHEGNGAYAPHHQHPPVQPPAPQAAEAAAPPPHPPPHRHEHPGASINPMVEQQHASAPSRGGGGAVVNHRQHQPHHLPPHHHHHLHHDVEGKGKENEHDIHDDEYKEFANDLILDRAELDPAAVAQNELISKSHPSTELEIAMSEALKRKEVHITRLTSEIGKLKQFISKRKQTYKRKRKDEGAPTRALSAYNIFVQDRFARLAKENEKALKSEDVDAELKRVPPANLVASTGNEWKELSAEEKAKYEERAKSDRKRYEEQMAQYQPPDKQANRKRNKTGYNMFFSAHVLRLKQSESGVPSERGSVARLVGNAWKQLSAEDKQYYEREADKHNGMNPVKDGEEDDDDEEKRQQQHLEHYHHHMQHHPAAAAAAAAAAGAEMHMHPAAAMGAPPPPGMHAHPGHDPRHHHPYYAPHMYHAQPAYGHYDYSQHHQRHQQARSQGYTQGYPPPQRHPYDPNMPM